MQPLVHLKKCVQFLRCGKGSKDVELIAGKFFIAGQTKATLSYEEAVKELQYESPSDALGAEIISP
jgi:hypothetical protein